jgi:hypothetical protein
LLIHKDPPSPLTVELPATSGEPVYMPPGHLVLATNDGVEVTVCSEGEQAFLDGREKKAATPGEERALPLPAGAPDAGAPTAGTPAGGAPAAGGADDGPPPKTFFGLPLPAFAAESQPAETPIRVIQLQRTDAAVLAETLKQLFDRGRLIIAADAASNSLIARGDEKTLVELQALLTALDGAAARQAESLVTPFNGIATPGGTPPTATRELIRKDELARRRAREENERAAQNFAEELRNRRLGESEDEQRLRSSLKQRLESAVFAAFEARQQSQIAELRRLEEELGLIRKRIAVREQLRDRIIQKRVDDLLNPDLRWEAGGGSPEGASTGTPGAGNPGASTPPIGAAGDGTGPVGVSQSGGAEPAPFDHGDPMRDYQHLNLTRVGWFSDGISTQHPIRLDGREGEVTIAPGETKMVHLPGRTKRFQYRWGDVVEALDDEEPFDYVLVEWSVQGRIRWTLFRAPEAASKPAAEPAGGNPFGGSSLPPGSDASADSGAAMTMPSPAELQRRLDDTRALDQAQAAVNAMLEELRKEDAEATLEDLRKLEPEAWQALERAKRQRKLVVEECIAHLRLLSLESEAAKAELAAADSRYRIADELVKAGQAPHSDAVAAEAARVQAELRHERAATMLELYRKIELPADADEDDLGGGKPSGDITDDPVAPNAGSPDATPEEGQN